MAEEFRYECPLCHSVLSKNKFYEVIHLEGERKKIEEQQKKELQFLKDERAKNARVIEDLKKKQAEKEKVAFLKGQQQSKKENKAEIIRAKKEGEIEGKKKQQKTNEIINKQLQTAVKDNILKNEQIKKLEEQLNKGKTSQLEGFELEIELVKKLEEEFKPKGDKIIHYGKGGDILHKIIHNGKEIGSILYECKKTKTFKKDYIKQVKQDMATRNATYGVLLTYAFEKEKAGFWTEEDILIVHPYGTIYLAQIVRKWLIDLYSANLNKTELIEQTKKLWEYIKSDKFKNNIRDTIFRTKNLMILLEKEKLTHQKLWHARDESYKKIYENTASIEKDSNIITKQGIIREAPLQIISIGGKITTETQNLDEKIDYQERLDEIKKQYPNAYEPWQQEEDNFLKKLHYKNKSINEIAQILKRQSGAIRARLKKLGLLN